MKTAIRSRLAQNRNSKPQLRPQLAKVLADVCEPLERRLMLSTAIKPVPNKIPLIPDSKITLPSQSFTGPKNTKPVRTVRGGGGTLGSAPTINVGPVVNISRATGNQTEADIAINPTNPDQIFAQSNIASGSGLFATRSSDGGVNWTTSTIATGADGLTAACCDGRVIYDKFGNLWLVYLNSAASQLIIARSTNNGASWTQMLSRSSSWDNPDIGTGADGSTWVSARGTGGVIAFGWKATGLGTLDTTIGGGTGFSANQVISIAGSGNYGDVGVANDGSVYVTWTSNAGGQGPNVDPIVRDPDGFGPAAFSGVLHNFSTNVGGFDFIPPQNNRSVDSEPQIVVAPAGSAFAGRIYFEHLDETVNENSDTDVHVFYSDDNGVNWTGPVRVNDDPSSPIRSQFLNQLAVDPTTGALVASWHDSRNDNGVLPNGTNAVANDDAQFFGALSNDGGATWTNFMIDPGWSNAVRAANGIDFGDWTGSDYYGGRFFAVWASNAQGVNGLPNNPQPNTFDLATWRVDITGVGQPGIYGAVIDDSNGNGVRDAGEPGETGVVVYIDADNSGTLNGSEINTTSGAGGAYSFLGLPAGTYLVRSVTPANQRPTFPASGSYNIVYDGTSGVFGKDFGFVNPRITGTVINDSNDNGVFDAGEAGLSGVTVYLDNDNSGTLSGGDISTTSAADGTYTLGGLANGSYIVRAVTPAGQRLTLPASGSYSATITNAAFVFTGDNFGFTDRVRITGSVYRDANGNGSKDAGETPYSGVRVFQDLNNNGVFDNTGGTFTSTNVPVAIPDNTTVFSNLTIAGGGNINSLTINLNITHTFDGDLVLTLISPLGTNVLLSNRRGGSGDNFTNTTFSDAAATSITTGVAPFTGTFKPEGLLSTLNGQNANGTWKLQVQDAATQDTGSITGWSITFGSTEPNVLTDAAGAYAFTGLSSGTYNIRSEKPANTVFTNPSTGLRTFNAVGGDLLTGDFGLFPTDYTGQDITLRLNPAGTNVQIWVDQPVAGTPTFTADKTIISSLSFTGTGGTDSLTIDAANGNPLPSGGATYDGLAGTNTFSVKGSTGADVVNFNSSVNAVLGGLTVTTNNTGVYRFDGRGGGDTLNANSGANVIIDGTQHLQTFFIASLSTVSVPAGSNAVIVTNSMALNGIVDLNDNDLILNYSGGSQLATVQARINSARNGGNWNGLGLTSTSAKNRVPKNTTLGAIEASEYKGIYGASATFDGEPLPGNAVLVKYTYYGDADFNGQVNFDDYSRIDSGFNGNKSGWLNGDFDGSGHVDFDDYSLIDLAFNTQIGVL